MGRDEEYFHLPLSGWFRIISFLWASLILFLLAVGLEERAGEHRWTIGWNIDEGIDSQRSDLILTCVLDETTTSAILALKQCECKWDVLSLQNMQTVSLIYLDEVHDVHCWILPVKHGNNVYVICIQSKWDPITSGQLKFVKVWTDTLPRAVHL